MLRVFSVLALAAFASVANAGVIVSSTLQITGLRLINDATGLDLVAGTDFVIPPAAPTITPSQINGVNGVTTVPNSGNILQSPGVSATTSATLTVPDTFVGLDDLAVASITSNSALTAARNLSVRAVFSVQAMLSISSFLPSGPIGFGSASTLLTFGLSGTATPLTIAPPAMYNLSLGGFGSVTSPITAYTTNVFNLVNGTTYGLTASQSSRAAFTSVPEPASICIFGLLGVAGFVRARRRPVVAA